MAYSSLHNHSMYSFMDGYSTSREMLEQAKNVGLKCIAYTDHGNQFAMPDFDTIKKDYPDIKILSGCEMYEAFDMYDKTKTEYKYFHLLFISRNDSGRIALSKIISKAWMEGYYYKPRIDLKTIQNLIGENTKDLVVCSACLASKIARETNYEKCIQYVNEYKSIFHYFYLEMQSHDVPEQAEYNKKILKLSHDTNTPYIITTDSHYAKKEDAEYQTYHVAIGRRSNSKGAEEINETYKDCYIQSEQEIHNIMDSQIGYDNVCIGLNNTNQIADICESVSLPYSKPELPIFPVPEPYKDNYEYLKYQLKQGWYKRHLDKLPQEKQEKYKERIKYELSIIHQMGFDGYFLIDQEMINWAKKNNYAIGPGRGSGAGCECNYLLGITEIDSIKFGLVFERFLNPLRQGLPDIDTDVENRAAIIQHAIDTYGKDYVCQVANISYQTNITSIKDEARVLDIPYKISDNVAKRFTADTWDECVSNCSDILEKHPEYYQWFDLAKHELGRAKNVGIHAGGLCIGRKPIYNYAPLFKGGKGEQVIELTKHTVESVSLVKYDFLGLSNLSIIKETKHNANLSSWDINIDNPKFFNDTDMYKVLQKGDTDNVFQMESSGMTDLAIKLVPENINDVSALLALYRPSSMKFLSDYIERKHNPQLVTYIHPDLKEALQDTYGLAIYQENILSIVRKMGNYDYGQADLIRRVTAKKDAQLAQQEAGKLHDVIIKNGYTKEIADEIAKIVVESAGYSFNKSHACSYSVLTLQTAWLKCHYPTEFYCAVLNNSIDDYGKLNWSIICAKKHNVKILHPSINKSKNTFSVYNGKILFGLAAIKGIGEKLSQQIIEERQNNGEYKGINDFIIRIHPSTAQIVMLVKSGAIPCKDKKEFLLRYADSLYQHKEYVSVKSLPKLSVLKEKFGIDTDVIKDKETRLKIYNEKRRIEFLTEQKIKYNQCIQEFKDKYMQFENIWEFEALSIFLHNNPFEASCKYIHKMPNEVEDGEKGVIVGVISNIERKRAKSGNKSRYAFVMIYSNCGSIEFTAWENQLKQYEDMLKRGVQVAILYKKKNDRYIIEQMKTYQQWLEDKNIKNKV